MNPEVSRFVEITAQHYLNRKDVPSGTIIDWNGQIVPFCQAEMDWNRICIALLSGQPVAIKNYISDIRLIPPPYDNLFVGYHTVEIPFKNCLVYYDVIKFIPGLKLYYIQHPEYVDVDTTLDLHKYFSLPIVRDDVHLHDILNSGLRPKLISACPEVVHAEDLSWLDELPDVALGFKINGTNDVCLMNVKDLKQLKPSWSTDALNDIYLYPETQSSGEDNHKFLMLFKRPSIKALKERIISKLDTFLPSWTDTSTFEDDKFILLAKIDDELEKFYQQWK
jgi:hypothetical protein